MVALEGHVESFSQLREHADGLQTGHGHQNAEEEQNRGHIDARQHIRHALLHGTFLFFLFQAGVEHLCHRPEHAQHEQNADERRQVGNRLENRHENQSAHTEEENRFALAGRKLAGLETLRLLLGEGQFALQRERQDVGRNHHRHERRQENLHNHARRRNHALVPEHDCRHVADGREGAARIGCNHHQGSVNQAVFLVADELPENHNHHNRRGQIVEDGRQDERHEGDAPEQFFLARGLQHVAHKIKAAVLINEFHDGHRAHQEEQCGRGGAEVSFNLLAHDEGFPLANGRSQILCRINHEERPADDKHQQRNGRLVHFRYTFDGNAEVADDESGDDSNS